MGNTFYNEILTDHNMNPIHKKKIENPTITLEGVNPSCGDDIILSLVV
jgi:nitrogen fixation NifU-like protein